MMFINFNQSFTDGTVSIYRHTATRLLQLSSVSPTPTLIGSFKVLRFDSLSASSMGGIDSFSAIFRAAAWMGLILIMVTVLLGYGVVCEEYILSMQLIFLHVYIASDYLPLTFRDTIGGLNLIENLNFFLTSHSQAIEHQWMGNVLQNGPIRFFLFNTDINFLREFFPIIIINIIYFLWFGLLWAARRYLNRDLIDEEKNAIHRFLDNTAGRVINFADQIWRYQFVATLWVCFVQFYNFSYPANSNRSSAINAILCILAFFCTLAWPAFVLFYTRRYYYECEYSEYLHYFEDIYYLKIPQYELPSKHHRMGYPLVKTIKLFLTVLVICYLGNIASLTLVILILLQVVELIYIRIEEIFSNKRYYLMKVIESGLFILMDVILLGLLNFSSLAISESYVYIGFILSGIAVLVILNSLVRVGYLVHKKYLDSLNNEKDWIFD